MGVAPFAMAIARILRIGNATIKGATSAMRGVCDGPLRVPTALHLLLSIDL